MWEPLQATLDPGRGLPLLVGPLWWKGYRPRVRPKREPKGTKRLRVDTQPTAQAPPQRHTERTHHQIESALHARVQGLHALVQEIEQTVDYMPHDVQGALLTPLTDLHSQLCGLVYVAWLLSLLHPHADDHDQ